MYTEDTPYTEKSASIFFPNQTINTTSLVWPTHAAQSGNVDGNCLKSVYHKYNSFSLSWIIYTHLHCVPVEQLPVS